MTSQTQRVLERMAGAKFTHGGAAGAGRTCVARAVCSAVGSFQAWHGGARGVLVFVQAVVFMPAEPWLP
jgi:hypothetical protein